MERRGRLYTVDEATRRFLATYTRVRPEVETDENIGKVIVLDVDTGDYEIDADHMAASKRAHARNPKAEWFATRVGYSALGGIGAEPRRLPPW